jgi:hypothetical protein
VPCGIVVSLEFLLCGLLLLLFDEQEDLETERVVEVFETLCEGGSP